MGQKTSAITGEDTLECKASVSSCIKMREETEQCLISVRKSLYERLRPYSSEVHSPFRLSLVSMCICGLFCVLSLAAAENAVLRVVFATQDSRF